jgi:serine/threonine protein kinase
MAASQQISRDTFVTRLRESGLLSLEQLTEVYALAAESDRGRTIAKMLLEKGLLTRFQAEMLLAGRTDGFLLGQYRILDEIGRGGMGRVFKAEHLTMRRVVALKVLANHLTKFERSRSLFQREVRAAARLIHPNIVTAYDANQSGDRHYLVMEYVNGPNLQELVYERGPLPTGQACDFIRQAALGLQCAFELGMVHRDIKPANLLLHNAGGQDVVKILDFGLARLHEPIPEAHGHEGQDSIPAVEHAVMGTPDYLSPEQAKNLHEVDIRSDLYSLGCTLYYLLTGQVPFAGGSSLEKLVRHASEAPPPIHTIRPDIPAEVETVVSKLMSKEPAQRFQTPIELAKALEPFSLANAGGIAGWPKITPRGPVTKPGVSPWSTLFDDENERVSDSTLPSAYASLTPVATDGPKRREPLQPLPPTNRRLVWLVIAAIAIALLLGFSLGMLVFAFR